MSKHTPGPWLADIPEEGVSEPGGTMIADVFGLRKEEQIANIRLIAAAPRTLEALKNLLNTLRYNQTRQGIKLACEEADAVIAEAEGTDSPGGVE